ncbi:hypothetical protein EBR04_04185, partial [bacterium]|nr:hypothetical protein [bacterium]
MAGGDALATQVGISWTGTGGNTNWSTSTNWNPTTALTLDYVNQYNMTFGTAAGGTSNNNIASGTVRSFIFSAGAGAFTITGSAVQFGNAAGITNSSTNTQTISLAGITMPATFSLDATSGEIVVNSPLLGANGFDVTGTRVTLTGSSSYTGASTVTSGALRITNSFALGGTSSGLTVATGAALELANGITVGAEPITSLVGTGISSAGALRNVSGTNTWGGLITLGGATRINSDAGELVLDVASGNAIAGTNDNLTFGGAGNITIKDSINDGSATLTKDGAGVLTLAASNTYSGVTTVSAGTLRATTSTNAMGQGTLTLNGGNLELANDTGLNFGRNTTVSTSGTIFSE